MKHKMVALKLGQQGNAVVVSRLGQAPRGQRFIVDSVKVKREGRTNAQFKAAIERAAVELLAQSDLDI